MIFRCRLIAVSIALCSLSAFTTAEASITAFFSAGTTCDGQPVSKFRTSGREFKVTLCLTATEESVCGHSVQLEAESPATSGRFEVLAHVMGKNYPDPTLEKKAKAIALTNPASPHDFGGTRDNPASATANQVLVTFTLRAKKTAKNSGYELRLAKNSLVSVAKDGSCLQNAEVPISAALKLKRE